MLSFQLFLKFSKPLFLQNRNTSVKIDYGNFKVLKAFVLQNRNTSFKIDHRNVRFDLSRKFFD